MKTKAIATKSIGALTGREKAIVDALSLTAATNRKVVEALEVFLAKSGIDAEPIVGALKAAAQTNQRIVGALKLATTVN
jgi:hypothetical protein